MTNTKIEHLNPSQIDPAQARAIGGVVAENVGISDPSDAQAVPPTIIEINGVVAETNLPFSPFENPSADYAREYVRVSGPGDAQIAPSELDKLPAGSYWLRSKQTEHNYERTLTMVDVPGGKAMTRDSLTGRLYGRHTDSEMNLLEADGALKKLGYVVSNPDGEGTPWISISGFPTPETFKNLAKQECDVDVRLFPATGLIPVEDYVQAFADGTYPVSTGTQFYYGHDTDPGDHVLGVFMGGSKVKELLKQVVNNALHSQADLGQVALGIDLFTSTLTHVILDETPDLKSRKPNNDGDLSFYNVARRYFGIDESVAAGIVESTLQNAREHGLKVDHHEADVS